MKSRGCRRALGTRVLRLVPHVALEGPKRKRTEAAPFAISIGKPVSFDKSGEKSLGQILCVLRRLATAPREGVEGRPIRLTQAVQRGVSGRR